VLECVQHHKVVRFNQQGGMMQELQVATSSFGILSLGTEMPVWEDLSVTDSWLELVR